MKNNRGNLFLAVFTLFLLGMNLGSAQAKPRRPNIILILTDDQGYGDLAAHGNPWIQTPHMDRLHAQSVRLTNYHTGTTCSPTRASLLTGQHFNRVGVWHTIMGRSLLRAGVPTLPDVLRRNGYRTGIFGKWHLGDNYPLRPQDRGFDEVLVHGGGGVGQTPDLWGNDYFDDTYLHNGRPRQFSGYCTDVWFTEALRFMEENKDRPFFCYLSTNAPHAPTHVPERYSDLYRQQPEVLNPEFYGMITNIDDNVGRLERRLQELGLAENTILIFTTDNGTSYGAGAQLDKSGFLAGKGFNAGMRGAKGSPYEGGHRTPFFLRFPAGGLAEGQEVDRLTSCMDVLPTLLELCGVKVGQKLALDGRSLVPLLRQPGAPWPARTLVVDTQREDFLEKWKQSAVMTDRWRLINGRELYDLPQDPGQARDEAASFPDTVQRLRQHYEAWWQDVSQRQHEYVRIHLGGKENPVTLTCHDLHPFSKEMPAWNQEMIRQASAATLGEWMVEVQKAGLYELTLRRWPAEARLANTAPAPPGEPVPGGTPYSPGRALPLAKASLQIGDQPPSATLTGSAADSTFRLRLPKGPTRLRAWFTDEAGEDIGAYYVYVQRVGR
jgi:arylsulfatase A-like enzyme